MCPERVSPPEAGEIGWYRGFINLVPKGRDFLRLEGDLCFVQ